MRSSKWQPLQPEPLPPLSRPVGRPRRLRVVEAGTKENAGCRDRYRKQCQAMEARARRGAEEG